MIVLSCNNLNKSFGIDSILENVNFTVNEYDKIGIIGVNGTGKTTLFKIISGIYGYDKEVIPYLTQKNTSFNKGIYVTKILNNSPASSTDLKEGDIINSFDGIAINTMNDLKEFIYKKKPGDTVVLQISRGKINKEISIVLGKK